MGVVFDITLFYAKSDPKKNTIEQDLGMYFCKYTEKRVKIKKDRFFFKFPASMLSSEEGNHNILKIVYEFFIKSKIIYSDSP